MPELLAQLRAALPVPAASRAANGTDGQLADWPLVASGLRELRASAESELVALSAQADEIDANLRQQLASGAVLGEENQEETRVNRIENDIERALPELGDAERHFDRVAALVRPHTTRLAQLETRAAFFAAALKVEKRGQRAKQHAIEATPEALASFTDFSALVHTLPPAYSAIREEARRRVDLLAVDLRRFAIAKLQRALAQIDWPSPQQEENVDADQDGDSEANKANDKVGDVASAFAYLVTLQLSQQGGSQGLDSAADADKKDHTTTSNSLVLEEDALWAMDCVLDAVLVRFRYHFERPESATNRLAKPEWMFMYILEQTRAHARFADCVLTPELRKYRDSLHCCDARILMLRGLISAAQRQLTQKMSVLATHPPLLCHVIDEVLLFEQAIDEEFDYGAFADNAGDRWRYPRCVDALTFDSSALFAWTKADVEYSLEMLSSRATSGTSISSSASNEISPNDSCKAWRLPQNPGGIVASTDNDALSLALVPPIASDVTLLLDFLCRRFYYMGSDEHRYLYVVQVFHPLLRQFADSGKARGSTAIEKISKTLRESTPAARLPAWRELFGIVNALQHVATTLATWEQSSVFLELANKLARSDATRSHVLKLHAAYAQTRERLTTAAKAASQAVLLSEEATAVRQALTGPGSMIGPTAAFSAAYAVGSKTMKSIFGGRNGEGDNGSVANAVNEPGQESGTRTGSSAELRAPTNKSTQTDAPSTTKDGDKPNEEEEDPEAILLFLHSIFERQISDLKTVIAGLLRGATDTLKHGLFAREMQMFRSSSLWNSTNLLQVDTLKSGPQLDVSSEIAHSLTVTSDVLALAQRAVLPECVPLVWKPLAGSLDDLMFAAISDASPTHVLVATMDGDEVWARAQLQADLDALARVFGACAPVRATRSYLRKTSDLSQLLALSPAKLSELKRALDQHDGGDDSEHSGVSDDISNDEGDTENRLSSAPNSLAAAGRVLDSVRFPTARMDDAGADGMEQLTTMLEACGVFTLTPSQVLRLLKGR